MWIEFWCNLKRLVAYPQNYARRGGFPTPDPARPRVLSAGQQAVRERRRLADAGRFALARAGNLEHADGRVARPAGDRLGPCATGEADDVPRPPGPRRLGDGEPGAAHRPVAQQDRGGVGIADVPGGALGVGRERRLGQGVALVDRPVVGAPAARTPAAAGDAEVQGNIKGGAVDATLATRDDGLDQPTGAANARAGGPPLQRLQTI